MTEDKKFLADVNVSIPYKGAGNSIIQKLVEFSVYREDDVYVVKPKLDESELSLANLPEQLLFKYDEHKIVSLRGPKDGNLHVMQDVYTALSDLNFKTL